MTVTANEFMALLLRHLIPENFKIIRYYDFYRKKHPLHDTINKIIANEKKKIRKSILNHKICIMKFFKRNSYDCPKCKFKFQAPIEAVLEYVTVDEWNGLPISTPPYTICSKCNYDKCVPINYKFKRGYRHIYKEK